ncbi:MAG: hypothetical protein QF570_20660 [Myxococcota bacterium]|nr:hypothetical protein [Myxococcota bacterium]
MSEAPEVDEARGHRQAPQVDLHGREGHTLSAAESARIPAVGEGWFEQPSNINKIIWALVAVCVASVGADLFSLYHKHGHYGFQEWIGFDAFYGFVSCVLLVLVAKQLRKVSMRDENYYD